MGIWHIIIEDLLEIILVEPDFEFGSVIKSNVVRSQPNRMGNLNIISERVE